MKSLVVPWRAMLMLLIAALVVAPHAARAHPRTALSFIDSGAMTMVTNGAAADLDPASNAADPSGNIALNIDETLVTLDGARTDRYKPLLSTSWATNADRSVWTFHLRHGVSFHTGRCCLVAQDVKYNLSRLVKAGLSNAYLLSRFITNPDKQIHIVDPYTVRFDLGRPQPIFIAMLTQGYAEVMLDTQALKAHATKSDPWAHAWAMDHDLGTGPYTIKSWAHDQQVVLTRFAAYWGGWSGPHFSTIMVRTVQESSTRRELMERGQADLTFELTPQDYQALSKTPQVTVVAPYATEVQYVAMTEWGPLASPYARQALSYAFNYEAFLTAAFHGYGKRAYGPLASTVLGYDPAMFYYHTDLAKAKGLLQKAGVKPGTVLTYAFTASPQAQFAGLILQAQLAQLGVTVKLQQLADSAFSSIFYGAEPPSKRPNLMSYGWWPDYNDPYDECVPLVASSSAGAAGANAGYYHNTRVDALLAQMKNAPAAVLIRDAHTLQNITSRVDPPAIWLSEPAQVSVLARSLQGYVFNPLQLKTYYFYTMHR